MNKKLITKKFLIAGGNSTLLAWNCPRGQRKDIVNRYLGEVEQVGFVEDQRLEMMGNELCVNGIVATAAQFGAKGIMSASGISSDIKYENKDGLTTVFLDVPVKQDNNIVTLSGIGFYCTKNKIRANKNMLKNLANKYGLPAFGIVFYRDNKIQPYVYVVQTNSLFEETACGSGSIAMSVITGEKEIIQPTGETIVVIRKGRKFNVSAKVTEVDEKYV